MTVFWLRQPCLHLALCVSGVAAGWYWNEGEAAKVGIIVATVVCSVLIIGCMCAMGYYCVIKPRRYQRPGLMPWEKYIYGDPAGRVRVVKVPRGPPDLIDRTIVKEYHYDHEKEKFPPVQHAVYEQQRGESRQQYLKTTTEKERIFQTEYVKGTEQRIPYEEAFQREKSPLPASELHEETLPYEKPALPSHVIVSAPPPYQPICKPVAKVVPAERVSSSAQTQASAIRELRRRERTRDAGVTAHLTKTKESKEKCLDKTQKHHRRALSSPEKRSKGTSTACDQKKKKRSSSSDRAKLLEASRTKGTQTASFPR